jgi:hypothetical protein
MVCLLLMLASAGCARDIVNADVASSAQGVASYSVTSYGAKGDGIADDGPAIQRAMNAAATVGGNVTFPCGEFALLSVASTAPGGRSLLYLSGAHSVAMTGQGSCTHLFTALPQKTVVEFAGSAQMSVAQMKISALNAKYVETYGMDGGSAVRFTGVAGGRITQVEVDGATAGALYVTGGTSNVTVANNYVHDTYGAGIWEDDCSGLNAQNCSPSKPPVNNIYDSNMLTNTTLAMLSALDLDDGNGVSNAILRNNTISWTRQPVAGNPNVQCIQVNNASNVTVSNNSCSGTPWNGIVITTGPGGFSKGVTIQGNTIQNSGTASSGGSGIVVYDAPTGQGISGFNVSDNMISTAANDGISLYPASKPGNVHDGHLLNNSITLVDQKSPGSNFGIDVESSAAITVSANTITCNGKCIAAGVNVHGSTATTPKATDNQTFDILGLPLVIR